MVVARYNVKHGKTPADDALGAAVAVVAALAAAAVTNVARPLDWRACPGVVSLCVARVCFVCVWR
jgi:hypothetical protein